MRRFVTPGLTVVYCALLATAEATTLYKYVDKDGRVTYSDRPPAESSGKTTAIPVDNFPPQAPKKLAASPREETEYEKIIRRKPPVKDESEVVVAKRRLEEAKLALEQARESASPEDWIYTGHRPGFGLRR